MELIDRAKYVLDELKKFSCDEALVDLKLVDKVEVYYEAGKISMVRSVFDESGKISLIKDKKNGEVVINQLSKEDLLKGAKKALELAKDSKEDEFLSFADHNLVKSFNKGPKEADLNLMYDRLNEFLIGVKRDFPLISLESGGVSFTLNKRLYLNSHGAILEESKGLYDFSMTIMGKDDSGVSSFNGVGFSSESLDRPFLDYPYIRRTLGETERQIEVKTVVGEVGNEVILHPYVFAEMFHYTISNFLQDAAIYTNTSLWKEKKGERVASTLINLSLNPLNFPGGDFITSDGFIVENMPVIKEGRLENFVLTNYGARRSKMERSKNSSINMEMSYGEKPLEEIIKGVKRGILLNRFSGGSPAENGDFAGIAKNSFLIEDGEIKEALGEVMVSGNLEKLFKEVTEVSKEGINDGYTSLPYVKTLGLKVFGK